MGKKKELMVWVMRDVRNANLDYQLTAARAKELYDADKLDWCDINQQYITHSGAIVR